MSHTPKHPAPTRRGMRERIAAVRTKVFPVVVLAAIALIPMIYSSTLVSANHDPIGNLDRVPAAVVNEDEGTDDLDLGATLTEELTTSTDESNLDWSERDADEAADALADGEVYAVLTIPAGFTADAVSAGGDDPLAAATATISVETNDGSNIIMGNIAANIAANVRDALAGEVGAEYLEHVYLGFTDVHDAVVEAADGAHTLADGTTTASGGAGTLVVGLNSLADGLADLESATSGLPAQAAQLDQGARDAASGATGLADGLATLSDGTAGVADGTRQALAGAETLQGNLDALAGKTPELAAGASGVDEALTGLLANWDALGDAERAATVAAIQGAAAQVAGGAAEADAGAQALATGSGELLGSVESETGLAYLADSAERVAGGAADASDGAAALRDGLSTLADGTGKLATEAPALSDGIAAAAGGAEQAESGGRELAGGLTELNDGAGELATGLDEGADGIPSYTDEEAQHLAGVASQPVDVDTTRQNEAAVYGDGLAPYFIALALWVGAIGTYLMTPALSRRALIGRGTPVRAALRSFAPGALMALAQSALATLVLVNGVGVEAVNPWGLYGMITLASLTFMAINQALIALLDAPGRFLALIFIVLQLAAAGGTYPIETSPAIFQAVHPFFPLSYAVESFRSLIAGGGIGIGTGIWVLAAWLAGALVVTTLGAVRARRGLRTDPVVLARSDEALAGAA